MHKYVVPVTEFRIFVYTPAPQAAVQLLHNHMPAAVLDRVHLSCQQLEACISGHAVPGDGGCIYLIAGSLDDKRLPGDEGIFDVIDSSQQHRIGMIGIQYPVRITGDCSSPEPEA
ncbi:hypothetical protein D3C73_1370050 [compost metagenome]